MDYRVILYHKHPTSARTRFLKYNHDSVCAFEALPKLSQLVDAGSSTTYLHPTVILQDLGKKLGFDVNTLKAETEYRHRVNVPGEDIQILLVNIDTMDPPFGQAEKVGASFIDLTQARGLPAIELELLRLAYELVLGG